MADSLWLRVIKILLFINLAEKSSIRPCNIVANCHAMQQHEAQHEEHFPRNPDITTYTGFRLHRLRIHWLFSNNVNFCLLFLVPKRSLYNRFFRIYHHFEFMVNFSLVPPRGRHNRNPVYKFSVNKHFRKLSCCVKSSGCVL